LACNGRRKRFLFMPFRHNSICKNLWWFLVFFYPPVSQLFWKLFRIKEAPDSSLFQLFQQPSKNKWFYTKRAFDHFIKFLTTAIMYQNGFSNVWELWFKVYNNWLFTDLYISEPQKTTKDPKKIHLNMVEKRLSKC
jgi:hypothetical protein